MVSVNALVDRLYDNGTVNTSNGLAIFMSQVSQMGRYAQKIGEIATYPIRHPVRSLAYGASGVYFLLNLTGCTSPAENLPKPKVEAYTLVLVDFADSMYPDKTIIGHVIDKTIENGMPIVALEWGSAWRTSEDYRTKLEEYPLNTFIEKDKVDGFSNPALEKVLESMGNQKLVVVGSLGEVCLTATASSAIDRGYKVHASDETSIEDSDDIHNASVTFFGTGLDGPVNSYKGVILWDRSSDRDYRDITDLVNGNFGLREDVYRRIIEEELWYAELGLSTALNSAQTYAQKLGKDVSHFKLSEEQKTSVDRRLNPWKYDANGTLKPRFAPKDLKK